jgi:hypothetical protein
MATQYTAGLSAGQILTAATMNQIGAVWETFTPAWTGTVTNPSINNGFIEMRYAQLQKIVIVSGYVIPGSTTAFGSGTYRLSLPITARSSNAAMGYCAFLDASAGYIIYSGLVTQVSTSLIEMRMGNGLGIWSPTVPVNPFANADQVRFTFVYEAA